MKRILVPSDFSNFSEFALQLAADIATVVQGEIFLINFTRHPIGASFTATGEIDKKYPAENNLYTIDLVNKYQEQLSEQAAKYYSSTTQINYQVYDDELKDGIATFIRNNEIDLVIMGTSGEESADEFFSGNHTEQVIEVAPCPVISLRKPYTKSDFGKIILGLSTETDRHDNFRQAATYLRDLATALQAKVDVVHVVSPKFNNVRKRKEELEELMTRFGLVEHPVTIIEHEDTKQGLITYANEHQASFLAVFTHAEDKLFRIFRSSLSEDLALTSDIPVITVNLHTI